MQGPGRSWRRVALRTAAVLIGAVTGALLLLWLVGSFRLPPDYDEAVYLSQVTPGVPAVFFSAPRSRGITFLVAPLTFLGMPLTAVRLWMVLLTAGGLTAGLWILSRSIGRAAPVAGLIFGASWASLFYATQVYPNMPSAVVALLVLALFVRAAERPTRTTALALVVLIAVHGLIRPIDATFLVAGLVLSLALVPRWRARLVRSVPVVAGIVLAWVPWVGEAFARCEGPLQRLEGASVNVGGGGLRWNVGKYLALGDGPLLWPDPSKHISPIVLLWVAAIGGLSVVGLIASRRKPAGRPVAIASICAACLAFPYVFYQGAEGALALRFLLPAATLASIPAAMGLLAVWSRDVARPFLIGGLILLLAWQVGIARDLGNRQRELRRDHRALGTFLRNVVSGDRCAVASQHAFPAIAVHARCVGLVYQADQDLIGGPVPPRPDPCSGLTLDVYASEWLLQRSREAMKTYIVSWTDVSKALTPAWRGESIKLPSGVRVWILEPAHQGSLPQWGLRRR